MQLSLKVLLSCSFPPADTQDRPPSLNCREETRVIERPILVPTVPQSALRLCRPTWGESRLFSTALPSIAPALEEVAWIGANELIRPNRDGLGTFGVVAQGVEQRQTGLFMPSAEFHGCVLQTPQ